MTNDFCRYIGINYSMNNNYSILLFGFIVIFLTSCKNNDEVFAPVVTTNLTVVNASADTLNFYLNGTRQNNTSSLFPGGSDVNATVPAGLQNYQFKNAGNFNILFSIPLTLKDSTFNTMYVAGQSSNFVFSTADNIPSPSYSATSDTAYIRFVNAAPDIGSLNVSIGRSVNFTALAFKSSSAFLPLTGGLNEVKIFQAGASTPKVDTIITFEPNSVYTLFAKGLLNGKGNAVFDVGIILNNP